jgi:hypothetical protein
VKTFLTMLFCFFAMTQTVFADYCSFKIGNKWVYSSMINGGSVEFIQEVTEIETQEEKRIYTMESRMNGTVVNTFKLYLENNSLFLLKRMNPRGETAFSPPRKEMICNATVGNRWTWKSDNQTDYLNYEATKEEEITVPTGKFHAIVVETSGFMNGTVISESLTWYADNVGTVKEAVNVGGVNMIRELTSYKVN